MDRSTLQKLLERDLENAQQLDKLLTEERGLLERRDVTALDGLLGRKADLLARMEKNDGLRRQYLLEQGFTPDRKGLRACCEQLDTGRSPETTPSRATTEVCDALFTALARCRETTAVNANIVHRSRNNNNRLLNLIRGGSARPEVYSPHGAAGSSPENRTLGSA